MLYLQVSTTEQTTANQERELREIAARMGGEVVREREPVSDIDTGVVDGLKALDPDGRLEKRTNSRHRGMSALCQ